MLRGVDSPSVAARVEAPSAKEDATPLTLVPAARLVAPNAPATTGPVVPWKVGRSNTLSRDNPQIAACYRGAEAAAPSKPLLKGKDIAYSVSISDAASGYFDVTMRVPTEGKNPLLLSMARWTPGSYSMRNFAKNVDANPTATGAGGKQLAITRPDTTMWSIDPQGASEVTVRYRVYAHEEVSVASNFCEPGLAIVNGAATFMTIAGDDRDRGCTVTINAPSFAGQAATSLGKGKTANTYRATSYDALVDAPIVLGVTDRKEIKVDGVTYTLATVGADGVWDTEKAAKALAPVLAEVHKLWGVVPFDAYTFLNVLNEKYGGLEHLLSTLLMSSRWGMQKDPVKWLCLACHELLHAWNVKRLRPEELGPFDYTRINATESLWVAEGLTEYYGNLLVQRAGGMSPDGLLERLSTAMTQIENFHGHDVQSLAMSSFESFTKFYHQSENTSNAEVSYYVKGAMIGFLLDVEIRKSTHGAKSLDDVMRLAYARYSGEHGYTPAQFEACASEIAGTDLKPWFDRMVRSTEEPPINESLASIGLRIKAPPPAGDAFMGVDSSLQDHRTIVTRVNADGPAAKAGIMPGDEIVSIGGYRVAPGDLAGSTSHWKAGDSVPIEVARHDKMINLSATFGERPSPFALELDPNASADAQSLRKGWLGV